MQRRKTLLLGLLAIVLSGFAFSNSVPKAHAYFQDSTNVQVTGFTIRNYNDPYFGYVDAAVAGSTLTFIVVMLGSTSYNYPATSQYNISMGVKFDWMAYYQNASNARPGNTYPVKPGQLAYLSVNVTIPNLTGQYSGLNQVTHQWSLEIWSTSQSQPYWTNSYCYDYYGSAIGCVQRSGYNVAIYSSTQSNSVLIRQQATAEIDALTTVLHSSFTAPAGSSGATALLAQAQEQLTLGDQAYGRGDFTAAQTDYQNSLNSANAAQSSLAINGGGTDTATMTQIWIDGVAALFGGIGALLLGFSGFKYLRIRSKALAVSTPK